MLQIDKIKILLNFGSTQLKSPHTTQNQSNLRDLRLYWLHANLSFKEPAHPTFDVMSHYPSNDQLYPTQHVLLWRGILSFQPLIRDPHVNRLIFPIPFLINYLKQSCLFSLELLIIFWVLSSINQPLIFMGVFFFR